MQRRCVTYGSTGQKNDLKPVERPSLNVISVDSYVVSGTEPRQAIVSGPSSCAAIQRSLVAHAASASQSSGVSLFVPPPSVAVYFTRQTSKPSVRKQSPEPPVQVDQL